MADISTLPETPSGIWCSDIGHYVNLSRPRDRAADSEARPHSRTRARSARAGRPASQLLSPGRLSRAYPFPRRDFARMHRARAGELGRCSALW